MPKVIATAQVKDAAKWEEGFRTHGDLFTSQTIKKPIHYNVSKQNKIIICFEPEDVDTFLEVLDSRRTEKAMEFDGVKRETVKVVVLDKEFDPR